MLSVIIFHVAFNHIVITKLQDHFLPSTSLCRVLGRGCAELFVQTCLVECAVLKERAHTLRLWVPPRPGEATAETQEAKS